MKRLPSTLAYLTSWLAISALISHAWLTHPEIFPTVPMTLWEWADSHYHAINAEEIRDLEFLVTFTIAAAVVLLAWIGAYCMWRGKR